jgi:FkbM family methyltransferase
MQGIRIQVTDGSSITVPASLDCLTTYVLLEQEDWFEKELPFIRALLQPGMRALDVGASYGLYSVGMGRAVGASGRVWSFEPSNTTLRFLRHTLAANGMDQVIAHDCALSDHAGQGRLSTLPNSELNSLIEGPGGAGEDVRIETLDAVAAREGIQGIDFVKLDAEGQEVRIVAGGQNFFRSEDPLVMFERRHGDRVNTELTGAFRSLDYRIYRLLGPATFLVPVGEESTLDDFELNLFACKDSCAARLEERGLLLRAIPAKAAIEPGAGLAAFRRQPFAPAWPAQAGGTAPMPALDAYATWRQDGVGPARRFGALEWAFSSLVAEAAAQAPRLELLSLLARVALESGRRGLASQILDSVLGKASLPGLRVTEPTWPSAAIYDSIPVTSSVATWLGAAGAEALITSSAFSGVFSGPGLLTLLDRLQSTPYASARMERRRQLQQLQAGRATAIEASPLLASSGPGHRNSEFWRCAAEERSTMPAALLIAVD